MIYSRVKVFSQEEFIDPCLCNAWVATAILGSAVIGGAVTAYSANKASDTQVAAATQAANTQLQMYNQTNANLSSFRNLGTSAGDTLTGMLPSLTTPIALPNLSQVNDPNNIMGQAYNFINTQGQKAVTNSAAARGLGTSGAALKGAATFATGSADTYANDIFNMGQTQFNDAVTNQNNAYSRLKGLIDTGENAAAQTGVAATATGAGVGASETAAGNASAAGTNAIGTAATNVAGAVPNALIAAGLYGGGSSTPSLYSGSSIPGAVGPTSVNGLPLALGSIVAPSGANKAVG